MEENNIGHRKLWVGLTTVFILSLFGAFAFFRAPFSDNQNDSANLSYDIISPYVKDYLAKNGIVSADGKISVSAADNGVGESTVDDAVKTLLRTGQFDYLKGDAGARGAVGVNGAAGANGVNGVNGVNGSNGAAGATGSAGVVSAGSGLEYSGGVISLKPCAVDQVLSYDGTVWDCATVAAGGVDGNTTNTTAALTLSGTTIRAAITDSIGNTVSSNQLDLGVSFVPHSALSNYATTASLGALDARVNVLENADYSTESWVLAQNYLTSSGLAAYLVGNGYVTSSSMASSLTTYLLKSEFSTFLNNNLKSGTGISISPDNTISSTIDTSIFTITTNHLAETNPNPNKIYVNTTTNPTSQWIYLNGADSAPTDPTNPNAWSQVGEVNVDLSAYSTTTQMTTAINQALTNSLSDLASNSNLNGVLGGYATQNWVTSQNYLTISSLTGYATQSWVNGQNYVTGAALATTLSNYATQSWVIGQNYTTNAALTGYATQSWVQSQNYLTTSAAASTYVTNSSLATSLTNYATQSWVTSQNYITNAALTGYATQSWVASQGYLTPAAAASTYVTNAALATSLTNYATQSWVTSQNYITNAALTGYATQSWVQSQNYLTTSAAASTYATQSSLTTMLGNYQPLITGAATTITNNNLTTGMVLQSDSNGKVAASSISLAALQTALNNISTLQSQVAANQAAITDLQNTVRSTVNYNTTETATGATINGKPIYRRTWNLSITQSAKSENVATLISTTGYVAGIIGTGGYFSTAGGTEQFMVGADLYANSGNNVYYGFVSVNSSNQLVFRSQSASARTNAPAVVWVDYIKN